MKNVVKRLRKIRWRRLPLGVASILLALFATYFVSMNAVLLSGLGEVLANRIAPAHAHFEWRRAYSPWLFRVHVTGFVFRGEDSSVQWLIKADEASATFGVADFASRRVRLHDMSARGLSTRIRFKVDAADATPDYVARLPKIDGFADAPLKPVVMPPPVTDANYRLWTVQIDDAVAEDVREVWVDTIRVVDSRGHLEGAFYLKPLRRLSVPNVHCRLEDATVSNGKDTMTSSMRGSFDVHLDPLDLRDAGGIEMLHHVDAKVDARANVGDLRFIHRWVHSARVGIAGGAGPIDLFVEWKRGALVPGSRVWVRSEDWTLRIERDSFRATSVVSAVVSDGKPRILATAETYALGIHRDKTLVAQAEIATASAQIENVDMASPFDRWTMAVDLPSAKTKDLTALNAYLDEPLLHGGWASVKAHANITPQTVSGHASLSVSKAVITIDKTLVTASGSAEATLHQLDLQSGKGDLAGARLHLHDVSGGDQREWWAEFSANPLSIALDHGAGVTAMITGKCKDAQLPLAILGASGMVRNAFGSQGFTGAAHAGLFRHTTALSDVRIIGNTVEVRAHYRTGAGAAFVQTPLVNVGVLIEKGESSTHLFVSHDWYTRTLRI